MKILPPKGPPLRVLGGGAAKAGGRPGRLRRFPRGSRLEAPRWVAEEVGPGQGAEIGTPGVRAQPAAGAVLGRAPGPRRCGAVRLGILAREGLRESPLELSQSPPSGNRTRGGAGSPPRSRVSALAPRGECREAAALTPGSRAPRCCSRSCLRTTWRQGRPSHSDLLRGPRRGAPRLRDMDGAELAGQILYTWLTLVLGLILLPSAFGVSLGISEIYMKILVKTLEWATLRIETGVAKQSVLKNSASVGIIQRDESPMEKGLSGLRGRDFELSDVFYFSKKGLEAIVEDEVTQRFSSEELVSWNLLTRTNVNFQYVSPRLTMVWVLGVIVRYCVLLPLRLTLAVIGISLFVIGTTLVGQMPRNRLKNFLSEVVHLTCCRICVRALSGTIHYHNRQYRPQKGGICVANHTSPIDVLILTTDGCYTMVGQVHGGLMGIIQRSMVKACPHIWFERSEMKDRHLVIRRLKEHIALKEELPILIFPEGTCINNTSVMMFKKGSFEIGGTIHPVAIKYNPRFGDAFWNSSKYNIVSYLLRVMTSWAIVCDVWYMPPMTREEGEDAVQFANRVKSAIAVQGGLTELPWDGGLKRAKVKDTFKEEQQKNYSKMIVGNGSLKSELD